MINIEFMDYGYTLGHADVEILRGMAKELQAYRQAFSEPVAWRHNDGPFGKVATCSQKVGKLWVSEGFDVTPLYRKPTIPE